MENNVIQILEEIRQNIFSLKYILFAMVGISLLNYFTNFSERKKKNKLDTFRSHLDSTFETGDYRRVILDAEQRLKSHQNDGIAIWWIARSHKELGDFVKARKYFTRLHMLEPGWRKEYVDPYISAIEFEEKNANKAN